MESETKPNKAHHENGQKEPLDPVKIAPTNPVRDRRIGVVHYRKKVSIRRVSHKARAQSEMTAPLARLT